MELSSSTIPHSIARRINYSQEFLIYRSRSEIHRHAMERSMRATECTRSKCRLFGIRARVVALRVNIRKMCRPQAESRAHIH